MAAVVYYRQVLIGGGILALDEIDGALLNDGDPAFVFDGTQFYSYKLDATSAAAESSPDIIAPDLNPGNKRWILQSAQNAGQTYTEITLATNLLVDKNYKAKNTAATHTLPSLAGLSDGDYLTLHITGGDATTIVNENALDSNAELATFYVRGDGARFTVVDGLWEVSEEKVSVRGFLAKTLDQSFAAAATANGFATDYSVEKNIGGWHDSVTNHRVNMGFNARIAYWYSPLSGYAEIVPKPNITGTSKINPVTYDNPAPNYYEEDLLSTDYIVPELYNTVGAAARILKGDAAKNESTFNWRVIERLR